MCGIAGISMANKHPVPGDVLARLASQLAHRGPDGDGIYMHAHTGMVHRRLSIIDVEGGQQPIADKENRVHIVVNGEIYNYLPLRNKLAAEGVEFSTASDSEIPLHLYKKYGLDFVNHLDGMYAIAIYDERSEDLILARDPMGIKPLYTSKTDEGFAFASEPSALVRAGWCPARLNRDALPDFINRQFTHGSETLFRGIHRVLPGEILRVHAGKVTERYNVPIELTSASNANEKKALTTFDTLFSEKVRTHLQAEVPYGAFLSGGIDSSSVVSKMADITQPIRTYTIGFDAVSVADERTMAENLATQLSTQHTTVEFSERDFWYYLPTMCRALDDLVADYAALPTLKLAQCAQTDVKIILSGEGGDEIFAGYGRYRRQSLLRRLMGRPFRGRGDAARFGWLFKEPAKYGENYKNEMPDQHYHKPGYTKLQDYQARDIAEWLPNDLLIKLDRCLMHYSIEGRVPLLDREMVSFAFGLADTLKVQGKKGKYLLKKWLDNKHPEMEVWSPKRGFTVPIQEWMEKKRDKISDRLATHPALDGVIEPKKFVDWLKKPLDSKDAKLLFNFLCLTMWYDIHIEGQTADWEW